MSRSHMTKIIQQLVAMSLLLLIGTNTFALDAAIKERLNRPEKNAITLLFLQQAKDAILVPQQKNCYHVTLIGIDHKSLYFSDQPGRVVGQVTATEFLDLWKKDGIKPNAALHGDYIVNNRIVTFNLVATLTKPNFDTKTDTWQYHACVTDVHTEAQKVPKHLNNVTLFIDNFDGNVGA
ncbi:MAG: hypothetical protein EXR81_02995 [Gammaproteobacteria bacterium]|nr:hypothetical protein [Gammaproteobacteria bacterium]